MALTSPSLQLVAAVVTVEVACHRELESYSHRQRSWTKRLAIHTPQMLSASVLLEADAAECTVPCTVALAVAAVVVIVVVDDDDVAVAVLEATLEPKEEAPEETKEPVKVPSEMSDESMRSLRRLNFPLACMERL